jgi:hypothetical protein
MLLYFNYGQFSLHFPLCSRILCNMTNKHQKCMQDFHYTIDIHILLQLYPFGWSDQNSWRYWFPVPIPQEIPCAVFKTWKILLLFPILSLLCWSRSLPPFSCIITTDVYFTSFCFFLSVSQWIFNICWKGS